MGTKKIPTVEEDAESRAYRMPTGQLYIPMGILQIAAAPMEASSCGRSARSCVCVMVA